MDSATRSFHDGLRKYDAPPKRRMTFPREEGEQTYERPTEVFLSLENPLHPKVIAVATPRGEGGRTIRYPSRMPQPSDTRTLESSWPVMAPQAAAVKAAREPDYEWGPTPQGMHYSVHDAAPVQSISYTSMTVTPPQHALLPRVARPDNRAGQKKLEQWRRAKSSTRHDANLLNREAASRNWADDGHYSPQYFPNSRSTSVLSSVSADSQRAVGVPPRVAKEKPLWVNPVDSSATQTEREEVPSNMPSSSRDLDDDTRRNEDSTGLHMDDHPRSDGWKRFFVGTAPLAPTQGQEHHAHSTGAHSERRPQEQRLSPMNRAAIRIHRMTAVRDDQEFMSSTSSVSPVVAIPEATLSAAAMLQTFQEQQEDMFRIIAAQQAQIEALTKPQAENVPCSSDVKPGPDVVPEDPGVAAAKGDTPSVAHPRRQSGPQTQNSTDVEALNEPSGSDQFTQTAQNQSVFLKGIAKAGGGIDDDDLTSRFDEERKRELAALMSIVTRDNDAHRLVQQRNKEEMQNTAHRREISAKLTRHLALQKRSSQASWSRSQSARSSREAATGGDEEPIYRMGVRPLEDAATMTDRASTNATPCFSRDEDDLSDRTARPPPPSPPPPPQILPMNPARENKRTERAPALEWVSRGTSVASVTTNRGTSTTQQFIPQRSHDPMEAFTALKDRYMNARTKHRSDPEPPAPLMSASSSSWCRV